MKKILFDMKLIDRHYCFYLDDTDNGVYAYAIRLNSCEGYHVRKPSEVQFLNKIITRLSNKYIRRKDVLYNNEYYARYKNTYTNMNYFAKLVDGKQEACSYESAKYLYDFYNNPRLEYVRRTSKQHEDDSWCSSVEDTCSDSFFEPADSTQKNGVFGRRKRGRYEAASNIHDDEVYLFEEDPTYNRPKKKGNAFVRVLTVAGIVCFAALTHFGVKIFADGTFINLLPKPVNKEEKTESTPKMEEEKPTDALEYTIEDSPRNELEVALKSKYQGVEVQLKALGLEPWQIAIELDKISIFQGDQDDITFYYDSETSDILYVFGEHTLGQETTTGTEEGTKHYATIPEGITQIMNAIANNPNLTEEEKSAIIESNLDDWIANYDYLSIDELVDRYEILEIEYDYQEDGKAVDLEYTPYTRASGVYEYQKKGGVVTKSQITLFNGCSLKESQAESEDVFEHENEHVDGNFSVFASSLLNEGYASLMSESSSYAIEQLMAAMMIETFGDEVIKEGYYGFDLAGVLTNHIATKAKRDYMDVRGEVEDFLEEIEMCLYKTGDLEDNFREDSLLMEEYQSLYAKFSAYYSLMNDGQKMSGNAITAVIMDYMLGTNETKILRPDERISLLRYRKNGTLEFTISTFETNVSFDIGTTHSEAPISYYSRDYVIQQDDKDEGTAKYAIIVDENLNYLSR